MRTGLPLRDGGRFRPCTWSSGGDLYSISLYILKHNENEVFSMKAKAAVFMGENLPFEVREFDITKTPLGYGRSRLIASGICGTDIHIHNGKLSVQPPTVIGHEFVGKLEDCDPAGGCGIQSQGR